MTTLPNSEESERGVIGSILCDPGAAIPQCVQTLTPEHFYWPKYRDLYSALIAMWVDNHPIDFITLTEKLRASGKLDAIGGASEPAELSHYVPSLVMIDCYIATLADKFIARRLLAVCAKVQLEAEQCEDSAELISLLEAEIQTLTSSKQGTTPNIQTLVRDALVKIEEAYLEGGKIPGLSTGLIDLDHLAGGMTPGQLIIIAADTSKGKTTLALNIVEHATIMNRVPCGVISLEMSGTELVNRWISSVGRINLHQFLISGAQGGEEGFKTITRAAGTISGAPIVIRDDSDVDAIKLRGIGRQMVHEHKIKILVVDYIQLLSPIGVKDENRERAMATAADALKHMAKELQIVVIGLSQVNDSGKLRESRAIGHHADRILVITRGQDEPELAFIHVDKNRNGPVGVVAVTFLPELTRFENRAREFDTSKQ